MAASFVFASVLAVSAVWMGSRPGGETRTKGTESLTFYVQRQGEIIPGVSGERFQAGDRLQFLYSTSSNHYLFLVSVDDSGSISNFNYRASPSSVPISPGSGVVLEGSIILDESTDPERVFGLFSQSPLTWDEVRNSAERAFRDAKRRGVGVREMDRLPLEAPQASVVLMKQSPTGPRRR